MFEKVRWYKLYNKEDDSEVFYMKRDIETIKDVYMDNRSVLWTDSEEEFIVQNSCCPEIVITFRHHFTKENPLYIGNIQMTLSYRLINTSAKTIYNGIIQPRVAFEKYYSNCHANYEIIKRYFDSYFENRII